MPEYIYSIFLVVVLIIFFSIWSLRKKNEIWEGSLEKKNFSPGDEDSSPSYKLIYRTKEGKKKTFTTYHQNTYDSWNIGDKASKKKGEYFPTKLV